MFIYIIFIYFLLLYIYIIYIYIYIYLYIFIYIFNIFIYIYIYIQFISCCTGSSLLWGGLSLVVASRGYSSLRFMGFSLWWFFLLQSMGCRLQGQQLWCMGLIALQYVKWNLCPLHWQADSHLSPKKVLFRLLIGALLLSIFIFIFLPKLLVLHLREGQIFTTMKTKVHAENMRWC